MAWRDAADCSRVLPGLLVEALTRDSAIVDSACADEIVSKAPANMCVNIRTYAMFVYLCRFSPWKLAFLALYTCSRSFLMLSSSCLMSSVSESRETSVALESQWRSIKVSSVVFSLPLRKDITPLKMR